MPALDDADEALVASLLAEDPGDFYRTRGRIWRAGPARWRSEGPELPARPSVGPEGGDLEQPVEAVVIDEQAARVLLPLTELGVTNGDALRLTAHLRTADLVNGLRRELQPTPWLTLAAGLGLTPLGREGQHLRVRWGDPACGFGLELKVEPDDFGPLFEPGPAGRPSDEPGQLDASAGLRLAPGTQLYADADGREPIVRLDPAEAGEPDRLRVGQRVRLLGKPKGKLQPIELRCRGVIITGYAPTASLVELPGRFAVVDAQPPASSSCAGFGATRVTVPEATLLFEPNQPEPALVGVVAASVELDAQASADGWWQACVPSPWGDLLFDFQLR